MDKTTKILLAFIAAGLWANALAPAARAGIVPMAGTPDQVMATALSMIADGRCNNPKLCGF